MADLKSCNWVWRKPAQDQDPEAFDNDFSREYVVQISQHSSRLATRSYNQNWYFDNAVSYYMSYNMHDFDNLTDLQLYILPKNNIILVNRSVILPDSISKVWFNFEVYGWSEQIFLIGVSYCTWLDTKLISLGILDRKSLTYFAQQGLFTVKDQDIIIITSQLNQHNLYCVNLGTNASLSMLLTFTITATTSQSSTNIAIWYCHFIKLNQINLKRFSVLTFNMKILAEFRPSILYSMHIIKNDKETLVQYSQIFQHSWILYTHWCW